jgi:hypothetical protein
MRPTAGLWFALPMLSMLSTTTSMAAQQPPQSCHLHAPADIKSFSRQPLVLPSVGDAGACDRLNRERFSARGRCHCFSDDPVSDDRPVMPDYPADGLPGGMLP